MRKEKTKTTKKKTELEPMYNFDTQKCDKNFSHFNAQPWVSGRQMNNYWYERVLFPNREKICWLLKGRMCFQLYANLICVHREVSGFIQIAELIVFPAMLGL